MTVAYMTAMMEYDVVVLLVNSEGSFISFITSKKNCCPWYAKTIHDNALMYSNGVVPSLGPTLVLSPKASPSSIVRSFTRMVMVTMMIATKDGPA